MLRTVPIWTIGSVLREIINHFEDNCITNIQVKYQLLQGELWFAYTIVTLQQQIQIFVQSESVTEYSNRSETYNFCIFNARAHNLQSHFAVFSDSVLSTQEPEHRQQGKCAMMAALPPQNKETSATHLQCRKWSFWSKLYQHWPKMSNRGMWKSSQFNLVGMQPKSKMKLQKLKLHSGSVRCRRRRRSTARRYWRTCNRWGRAADQATSLLQSGSELLNGPKLVIGQMLFTCDWSVCKMHLQGGQMVPQKDANWRSAQISFIRTCLMKIEQS